MPAPKKHKPDSTKAEGGAPIIYSDAFIEKEATAFLEWLKDPKNLYFKRFALERDYHPQRLSEFAQKSKRFSEAVEKARLQEVRLVERGLSGENNSSMTKFVLQNCHMWAERSQQTVSGDAVNPLSFIMTEVDGKSKDLVDADEE